MHKQFVKEMVKTRDIPRATAGIDQGAIFTSRIQDKFRDVDMVVNNEKLTNIVTSEQKYCF